MHAYLFYFCVVIRNASLAKFTLMRFLFGFGMSSDVRIKIALLSKAPLANITLIRFLFGVSSDVRIKIAPLGKTALTNVTLIRFLFGVSSDV